MGICFIYGVEKRLQHIHSSVGKTIINTKIHFLVTGMRIPTQPYGAQPNACDRKSYFPYGANGMGTTMHHTPYYEKCAM